MMRAYSITCCALTLCSCASTTSISTSPLGYAEAPPVLSAPAPHAKTSPLAAAFDTLMFVPKALGLVGPPPVQAEPPPVQLEPPPVVSEIFLCTQYLVALQTCAAELDTLKSQTLPASTLLTEYKACLVRRNFGDEPPACRNNKMYPTPEEAVTMILRGNSDLSARAPREPDNMPPRRVSRKESIE
jgi:hypothetical protein